MAGIKSINPASGAPAVSDKSAIATELAYWRFVDIRKNGQPVTECGRLEVSEAEAFKLAIAELLQPEAPPDSRNGRADSLRVVAPVLIARLYPEDRAIAARLKLRHFERSAIGAGDRADADFMFTAEVDRANGHYASPVERVRRDGGAA